MTDSNPKNKSCRCVWSAFLAGLIVAALLLASINGITSYVTRSEFCGTTCHEMVGVYKGWQTASHHDNSADMITPCADCHLPPRDRYVVKFGDEIYEGGKNLYLHFFGPPYDPNANQKRVLRTMPDERCTRCHDNLLAKPSSTAARIAHEAGLNKQDPNAPRCVDCHAVMHKRQTG